MAKVSVIVAVYNVEKYLNKCVDSLLAQTLSDIEILLVDDGSTDGSGRICDDYAGKDNRVRVIHKENGGLSDARNRGIEEALAEYIGFIDKEQLLRKINNGLKSAFGLWTKNPRRKGEIRCL